MNEINGLPAHVLLIHLVVIGVPLAALLTVLSAVWPAAQRRLGLLTPIVALLALITVPVTTKAGNWLQARVYGGFTNPLIVRHAALGGELLPWAVGLFVVAVMAWAVPAAVSRPGSSAARGSTVVKIGIGVLAVAIAGISLVQVYRIGDAGAKAAWSSNFCARPYVGNTCPTN